MKRLTIILTTLFITALLFALPERLLANSTRSAFEPDNKYSYNAPHSIKGSFDTMQKPFKVKLQYIAPQHALSHFAGWLSECRKPWLKNYLIRYFLNRFDVDMSIAVVENPYDYPTFNSFFTRHLKPEARPITQEAHQVVSPADGSISQIGRIENDTLLQAKGFDFNLTGLLGGSEKLARLFHNGSFATVYLSPKDYHRVHMPMTGKLRETIFIPGKLFSVNQQTANSVPQLFARNERLVCIFDTEAGPMAVILVGAMIVGSINTVWHANTTTNKITVESYAGSIELERGAELGHFKLGSTVIVLFGKDKTQWLDDLQENTVVQMGQTVGKTI
jgi:phosphatidylserine decarboxylase